MVKEFYRPYRGELRAGLTPADNELVFVTTHPEEQPTELYQLHLFSGDLKRQPLPCGMVALALRQEGGYWLAGTDRQIYRPTSRGGYQQLPFRAEASIAALVPLAWQQLAILDGAKIQIVSTATGELVQSLELPATATCAATDATGTWLAVGTDAGRVVVWENSTASEWQFSDDACIHAGAVTALLFEPNELRFFSAGADNKLFSTFARGRLEPEDKGKNHGHSDIITSMVLAPADRLITGSRDGTLKSWPLTSGIQPVSLSDGCAPVIALQCGTVTQTPVIIALCSDQTIRVFPLASDGRFLNPFQDATAQALSCIFHGAMAWIEKELAPASEIPRRQKALLQLARWNDRGSIERISQQMRQDANSKVRLKAAQLLAKSSHPRALPLLQEAMQHPDEAIRVLAFKKLYQPSQPDWTLLEAALNTQRPDLGRLAIEELQKLAVKDDQALARLIATLQTSPGELRQAAFTALQHAIGPQSPRVYFYAFQSQHSDVRISSLVQAAKLGLLDNFLIRCLLRQSLDDPDATIRELAFWLSVRAQPRLLARLRQADRTFQWQIRELEQRYHLETSDSTSATPEENLTAADYEVLLEASASRSIDTCLRGATALAILQDPRALGILLQLTRHSAHTVRAEVCQALARFEHPAVIPSLRFLLHDKENSVRDLAYSALERIHQADLLTLAEIGLNAPYEDIRGRALQTLLTALSKSTDSVTGMRVLSLIQHALNDPAQSIRREAYKAIRNRGLDEGPGATRRVLCQSIHADIRHEVLKEAIAQQEQPWAAELIVEFFQDPDPALRLQAFKEAARQQKDLQVLRQALGSRYPDVRRMAVTAIRQQDTPAAQQLLLEALNDSDDAVRQEAMDSLISTEAREPLRQILSHPRLDVRVRAAVVLARFGDPSTLPVLLDVIRQPEPAEPNGLATWLDVCTQALGGLASLSDPAAVPQLVPLLDSPHAAIRHAAVVALAWSCRPDTLAPLRSALTHADPKVRYQAALGLAYAGDATVLPLLKEERPEEKFTDETFAALLALGEAATSDWISYLHHSGATQWLLAFVALQLLELSAPGQRPERWVVVLSSPSPWLRLMAAYTIKQYSHPQILRKTLHYLLLRVLRRVINRSQSSPTKISPDLLDDWARILAHAPPPVRARAARFLPYFLWDPPRFLHEWRIFASRYAAELKATQAAAQECTPRVPSVTSPNPLRDVVIGVFIGAAQDSEGADSPSDVPTIRMLALRGLTSMARHDVSMQPSVLPVLIRALSDPFQEVRQKALALLQVLRCDREVLCQVTIESGHRDVALEGLKLLASSKLSEHGEAVLEQVMRQRLDDLAIEAAKLLLPRLGRVTIAQWALDAAYEPLRKLAISWLESDYETQPTARSALEAALQSRYRDVRLAAAIALAEKKNATAIPTLTDFLREAHSVEKQKTLVQHLTSLGDRQVVNSLLDRVENDPAGTAAIDLLLSAAAQYRDPTIADRLLALAQRQADWQSMIFDALAIIAGADQPIEDPDDEKPDNRDWLTRQHPRHDDVLAKLLTAAIQARKYGFVLQKLGAAARWALGSEVNTPLAEMAACPNLKSRIFALEAIGFRLRKRNGPAEPLLKALKDQNPTLQFYAAEGLALAGRSEGLTILLSSYNYLPELALRERALRALGELRHPMAFDLLSKLVHDDKHPHRPAAIQAIGGLLHAGKHDEIFNLLKDLSRSSDEQIASSAVIGLYRSGSPAAWAIIRQLATDETPMIRSSLQRLKAIQLLAYDDTPTSRELLVTILRRETDPKVLHAASVSASHQYGPASLEPYYPLLENPAVLRSSSDRTYWQQIIQKVIEHGEPQRLLAAWTRYPETIRQQVEKALLRRKELPIEAVLQALDDRDAKAVGVAARIICHMAPREPMIVQPVTQTLLRWWNCWQELRSRQADCVTTSEMIADTAAKSKENEPAGRKTRMNEELSTSGPPLASGNTFHEVEECVLSLLAAAHRIQVPAQNLIGILTAQPNDPAARTLRREALCLLGADIPIHTLERLLHDLDPTIRRLAADLLADRKTISSELGLESIVDDHKVIRRLSPVLPALSDLSPEDLARPEMFAMILPVLVTTKNLKTLATLARNRKSPEVVRLGAIEGIGRLAMVKGEAILAQIGADDEENRRIRQAAWRARRRSQRARDM